MKTVLKILGILLAILIVIGGVIFFFFPGVLIDMTNAQNARAANLVEKNVDVEGYNMKYFASEDMSKKETLVLVHGMGDDKNSFVLSSKFLQDYNLILPELAGHGQNAKDPTQDYSIDGHSTMLHQFLQALGIQSFHLGGNSMGGHTSASYAIKYPEEVKTLTLINAPGVPVKDHVVYAGFGKPVKSKEELNKIFARVMVNPPSLPGPLAKHMIKQVNSNLPFVDTVLVPGIRNGKDFNLQNKLSQIQAPTLILWGKHDEVVPFKVAQHFDADIPQSEINLLENGSHSPQLEIPEEVSNAIDQFIKKDKKDMITSSKNKHAALTQYYRWYQLYEREINDTRIANQMDILDSDVIIKSAAGEMKGSANYPARLDAYKGWKNAHQVDQVSVFESADGKLNVEADITYQNVKSDGEESRYTLHYSTFLDFKNGQMLPKFTELNLLPTGQLEPTRFVDQYPSNRAKSLMHYWLLNMEMLDGNVTPFKELLAKDFKLNFSTSSPITTIDGLEKWLNGVPKSLKISSHTPQNIIVKDLGNNQFEFDVDFHWKGVANDGQGMQAATHHKWLIKDDINERFARIKRADVEQVLPLEPIN